MNYDYTKCTLNVISCSTALMEEEDQLQLALAVSASLHSNTAQHNPEPRPSNTTHAIKKRRKIKRFRNPTTMTPPPLLLTTSPEAKRRLQTKVDNMLREDGEGNTSDDISCTPAYPLSNLGVPKKKEGDSNKGVTEVTSELSDEVCVSHENVDQSMIGCPNGAVAMGYKTMWQLCAYCESEPIDEFYVEMFSGVLTPKVSGRDRLMYKYNNKSSCTCIMAALYCTFLLFFAQKCIIVIACVLILFFVVIIAE